MTNAEKYKEVFGFEPNLISCPTNSCGQCPCDDDSKNWCNNKSSGWWLSEYKENKE